MFPLSNRDPKRVISNQWEYVVSILDICGFNGIELSHRLNGNVAKVVRRLIRMKIAVISIRILVFDTYCDSIHGIRSV